MEWLDDGEGGGGKDNFRNKNVSIDYVKDRWVVVIQYFTNNSVVRKTMALGKNI